MPPESVGNSLEYPRKSCLKGVRLKLPLAENHNYVSGLVGVVGVFGHFCGLHSVHILTVVR